MSYNKEKTKSLKKQKNYEELFAYLSEFAKSEIPEALNELAECYYWGFGTEKDYTKSFYYDNIAANLGNADSIAVLGFDYEHGVGVITDQNRAIALYQQAVSLGSTRGMTYLGQCFENGTGVNKDCEMAVTLYRQAAEQGYARAQRILGLCYEKGIGMPEDKCKAVYWYKKSAEQDSRIAQRWLAMCFEYGGGVDADISQAIEWYLKAVENDDNISRVNLACIYFDKFDDEEKDRIALGFLQTAIKSLEKDSYHYYLACFKLAAFYENGYLVDRDPTTAFNYCKIAAEGGLEQAFYVIAEFYKDGIGTPIDIKEAVYWYEKCLDHITNDMDKAECYLTIANTINDNFDEDKEKTEKYYDSAYTLFLQESTKGNVDALIQLGLLYYDGKGVRRNFEKVYECFEKAYLKREDKETVYYIATCFMRGIGIKKNEQKGYKILKDAYDNRKSVSSALLLCFCYICGIGVKANYKIAKIIIEELLAEYSDDPFVSSYTNLYQGLMYFHGIGEKQDLTIAKKHFLCSPGIGSLLYAPLCDGDYSKANLLGLFYYGNLLNLNTPLSQNDKFAEYFLELAYDNCKIGTAGIDGLYHCLFRKKKYKKAYEALTHFDEEEEISPKCRRLIGQHQYYGCGTKKDVDAAIKNFDCAYMSGDDIAKVYMACCYAYGIGVKKNEDTARDLLENNSLENGSVSNVLRGLLIYSGNWGYRMNKEQGLSLIGEYSKNSRYNLYYTVLSSKRGDYYASIFIDNHLASLHSQFDARKRIKLILPQSLKLLSLFVFRNPYSENLTKKEMLRILLSQNQTLIEQGKSYADNQIEMAAVLGQIQINTDAIPQIIGQQKELIELMRSIIDSVTEQKKNLPNEGSLHFLDETQVEQIQSRFIEETATKIIDSLQEKSVSVEKEEALLKGMFGEHWFKLDVYTRKSLLSARVLFNQCSSPEFASLDHSGVVVSATSALENELKRRLFTGFQTFMKDKLGTANYSEWPELLVFRSKKGDLLLNKSFPLGSLPYLLEGSDKDKEYLSEYLSSILSEQYTDKGLLAFTTIKTGGDTFLNKCEKIRVSFRNAAAHTGLVDRTKAEACCNAIIGPNEASEKIGQVQGLLYDLVQMTDKFQ